MHELRSEMARIHEEIQELRQMVESCMEWQGRLEQSIKQEILDAVHQSGWRTILLIVSYNCLFNLFLHMTTFFSIAVGSMNNLQNLSCL